MFDSNWQKWIGRIFKGALILGAIGILAFIGSFFI